MNAVRFSNECESMDENSYTRAGYRALGHVARCALLVSPSPSPSHPRNSCAFKGDMWPKGEDVHLGIAQFRALLLRPPGTMLVDMSKNEPIPHRPKWDGAAS